VNKMARQILVTLDGSALSRSILPFLPAILRFGDEVLLITVGPPPAATRRSLGEPSQPVIVGSAFAKLEPDPPDYAEDASQALESTRAELRDYLDDESLFLRNEGFTVKCEVLIDRDPANAIVGYAREHGPLYIAMATHGRGGLDRAVHGSVAEAVVRSGVAPVLVFHPGP
jgi:nucleotide-binding universal stress UspA family protein